MISIENYTWRKIQTKCTNCKLSGEGVYVGGILGGYLVAYNPLKR